VKKRVGFCCKWIDHDGQINGIGPKDDARALSTRSLTLTWMNNNLGHTADMKLIEVLEHNLRSVELLLERVAARDDIYHMVRLGSDLLPLYSLPYWREVYRRPGILPKIEDGFGRIGDFAREHDIRLSFHPGEFTVLASHRPDVVQRSIDEMEYHADMVYWMGYTDPLDVKINVHIAGQMGARGIIEALPYLSRTARENITIENSEMNWGIEESLKLEHHVPLVLDIHHHWVKTGEYIEPDDPRVLRIVDSWKGKRPVIHYSLPREDVLIGHDPYVAPDFVELIKQGFNKPKLRAHSDYYWNQASNQWAWRFHDDFDIQLESKAKNLSQERFVKERLLVVS